MGICVNGMSYFINGLGHKFRGNNRKDFQKVTTGPGHLDCGIESHSRHRFFFSSFRVIGRGLETVHGVKNPIKFRKKLLRNPNKNWPRFFKNCRTTRKKTHLQNITKKRSFHGAFEPINRRYHYTSFVLEYYRSGLILLLLTALSTNYREFGFYEPQTQLQNHRRLAVLHSFTCNISSYTQ